MNDLLVLDFNNIMYRSINSKTAHLTNNGKFTGGVYGFINTVCSYVHKLSPSLVAIALDSPPYLRKKAFPEYKERRSQERNEERDELIRQTREYCMELIHILGVPILKHKGMEADDIFAHLAQNLGKDNITASSNFTGEGKKILLDFFNDKTFSVLGDANARPSNANKRLIIASNDDDLYQLFDLPGTVVLFDGKAFYDRQYFDTLYKGVSADKYIKMLALAGTHNGIKGVQGIGIKTAYKRHCNGTFDALYEAHKKEADFYSSLIKLPYEEFVLNVEMPEYFDDRFIYRYLNDEYGIVASFGITEGIKGIKKGLREYHN